LEVNVVEIIENIIRVGLKVSTPLLLASLGEIYAERSGILNLGVEGMMMAGGAAAFLTALWTGNPWVGVLVAMVVGAAISLVHAVISIHLRGNQVVSGLALTMFGLGLASVMARDYIGTPLPTKARLVAKPIFEGADKIPVVGRALLAQDPLFYISLGLAVLLWFVLFKTRIGVIIRSVGENPAAADALGVNVYAVRYACTLFGGAMAGLGGAHLMLAIIANWTETVLLMGKGWIAIALVIFALWSPLRAIFGSYFFGIVEGIGYSLQLHLGMSEWLLSAVPYALTILILVAGATERMRRKMGAPAALGVPYVRGEK